VRASAEEVGVEGASLEAECPEADPSPAEAP
jgi:hypothetical protein